MASAGSTKESDSSSSGSSYTNSSSGDEDAQYRGEDVYGEELYQVDYGAPGAGRSSEQLLKKGPVRYWFERICVSSYHDRRIPELRSFGIMWIMFSGSYTAMALRDFTLLTNKANASAQLLCSSSMLCGASWYMRLESSQL
ncbi:uncharacterized protein LOC142345050 [Convolutriloba macropyga]|uniref:uncharacterized protein LOC142345050 n=1 Tax=Convolutriloba macropyga TaxID=536237 RepID=UPI003F52695D